MPLTSFNKRSRPALFQRLREDEFDLLVIGGGITGTSLFRDAALRGMRVVLAEAKDFASGTSSRSSKLIHGGLRYVKQLGFRLAWESCHERNLHVRLNDRLVRPIPFLVPLYEFTGISRALLRVGMIGYEILGGLRNHRWHRFLSREETLLLAPGIREEGLLGGCLYYDAMVSDNRWTLEIVKDGVRNGGLAMNYAPVVGLTKTGEKVAGARVQDALGRGECELRARAVVNATGIFSDAIRRMDDPAAAPRIRFSKGTHLVFEAADVPLDVTTGFLSPIDERPLFLVKRDGCFLYGTSDDWEDADPWAPKPSAKDVEYLLDSLQRYMPDAGLDRDKVQFLYSGFRPLLSDGDHDSASREDVIETSKSGLVSVLGGKLTTARLMAIRVLDLLGDSGASKPCQTHRTSIGGSNEEVAEGLSHWIKRCPAMKDYFRTLYLRYGVDADEVCAEVYRIHCGEHPDPRAEPIRAEVEYVCRHEMTCTLEDLVERRAGYLYWNTEKRLERLRYGQQVIQEELDLNDETFEEQFTAYARHLQQFHTLPDRGVGDLQTP
jgi:glycerol-3-phosphate dehydrogenase